MKKQIFFSFFALLFFSLAVLGAYKSFSLIPHWDMWESYLNFNSSLEKNNIYLWWEQHNEHRPILSKILFFIDFTFFNGKIWFLILINYLLVAFSCLLFILFARKLNILDSKWIPFFVVIWLYSYIQKENLTWGFQSQFFLAYLLPLTSLYFLQKSMHSKKILNFSFIISSIFGIASVFTMANGMLILILNVIYAIIFKMGIKRITFLTLIAILFWSLYFYDYSSPTHLGLGTISSSLKSNPLGMIHYTLLYIGNPFYYFFGKGLFGQIISISLGLFLISSCVWFSSLKLKYEIKKNETIQITLLFFIIFVICTAVGTSGGRIVYGTHQALTSRYATPSLMAWLALFLIYLQMIKFNYPKFIPKMNTTFIILVILMFPRQLKVLESNEEKVFEKEIAGIALELRINDLEQYKHVYHSPHKLLELTEKSFTRNLFFFGFEPFKNLNEMINKEIDLSEYSTSICQGKIESIKNIESDKKYAVLRGKIKSHNSKNLPKKFFLTDETGLIKGVVIVKKTRRFFKKDNEYFYKGYYLKNDTQKIIFISGNKNCFFSDLNRNI